MDYRHVFVGRVSARQSSCMCRLKGSKIRPQASDIPHLLLQVLLLLLQVLKSCRSWGIAVPAVEGSESCWVYN